MYNKNLGIRWTIGDVSRNGFEALKLSIHSMWNLFGKDALYTVCVNSVSVDRAKELVGLVPDEINWYQSGFSEIPQFIRDSLDKNMAEGTGWKFAPLYAFPGLKELSLDNDCIIWELPAAIEKWLDSSDDKLCVFAEDVKPCLGQFTSICKNLPRNSGTRGIPPGFDYENIIKRILLESKIILKSEQDEQGLQYAAVSHYKEPLTVTTEEVSICSPFPPHLPYLGKCGVHFVGLNAKNLIWDLNGKPAVDYISEKWMQMKESIYKKIFTPTLNFIDKS